MKRHFCFTWVMGCFSLVIWLNWARCKPGTPSGILSKGKMTDVLYDYHLALAMSQTVGQQNGAQAVMYKDAVLRKYNITQAEFDSSMVYYMRHTEQLHSIYQDLCDRIDAEAVSLGANASDMNRFGDLSSSGDTTNIWKGARSLAFMPCKPLNYYNFEIPADSSFHKGDCIMLDFDSQFIYQDGIRDGLVVLAIEFDNDSIASQLVHVQSSQHYSMQIEDSQRLGIKKVKGYFLLNPGDFNDEGSSSTTLKLMFLEHIKMIKMHKKQANVIPTTLSTPTTSQSPDSLPRISDSLDIARDKDKMKVLPAPTNKIRRIERLDVKVGK